MNTTQIIPGSISDIAMSNKQSIAVTFVGADCVVIVDTSGSMGANDSTGGKSRYEVACKELAALQANMPGKIAVLSFASTVMFCPDGKPLFIGGGTDLTHALKFAKIADIPPIRFFVISDGQPDDPRSAIAVAGTYKNTISVIYVGPEQFPNGRDFLEQLAKASGGEIVTADRVNALAEKFTRLLEN